MKVFCVAEYRFEELNPLSIELLNLANQIKGDGTAEAVVIGKDVGKYAEELAKYADKVWKVEDDSLENYTPDLYVDVLLQLAEREKPDLILIGNTAQGGEFAPYLAAKMNVPIATDVVAVDVSDGVKVSRYLMQGKLMVDLKLKSTPAVLTIRQGVFKEGPEVGGEIVDAGIKPSKESRRKFVSYIEPEVGEVDITQADIIVSVGRGIEDASNIELAEELAELLGGVVAGSRPVIDNGWLPKDRQVGISGKVVKPKLYLALGISGAFQHIMGMKDSELIIAINKDPEAPIFGVAHYGVVADLFEVVPELIEKLKEIKG
ncbi:MULTISPECIES: electron transfer flavoprotein subunit alpha/FixB family protein [Archaeoglobus]|jgi:electron transfer flavoprotein alpha subunit|uniref:Electron transfer flavoprotein, subunit alpha (EtfA) n=3 Tax=Archaeoglobus fulgidus TaxID=2234 RepID=O29954_ARCFU|nr:MULTISPECIES: electron transfer flavoprotein subunit alpha/FixB family protein [Archaeoglobus]AAB90946.1 electron transfer flavoprotein, subunit alpha (etfA) [Archaeoglobus fulgidus DSM 4304]AIG97107.1 Electron transfer flavoprotein, alpha subunit [Archaeoglobus fulgidus DSM 8774]KUJ94473.1 MAG: Electron transfer flavoprotein, subunit alpha (EtfA) [Archaeoglobus fulgidus]KUK05994.1 MAG: Electron transfer flavoprotein, subunit alpha (EtfA) [Archaeoglobus fulgidus]MDI3498017.1 electron transf